VDAVGLSGGTSDASLEFIAVVAGGAGTVRSASVSKSETKEYSDS
jgi:hypothetical protein